MSWFTGETAIQEKLTSISNYFGLGYILFTSPAGGYANQNYFVTTSTGEYVFKLILHHPREDVEKEVVYLKRLEEYAFPAAYYLQASDGSSIYQGEDYIAVALRKLQGQQPEISSNVNRVIGFNLAKLHLIPAHSLPRRKSWLDRTYLPEAVELVQDSFDPGELQKIMHEYDVVRSFHPEAFPQSMVHGDLVPHNCLCVGDELSAFLDWEEVGIAASVLDFAMCVLNFCFIQSEFDQSLYRSLFESYSQVRSFTREEENSIEMAVKYMGLTGSVTWLLLALKHSDEQLKAKHTFYWKIGLDRWT